MKISWGIRIAVVYTAFVIILVTAVIIFMSEDVHLVTDEYYAKELVFQDQIDKVNRTNQLTQQLEINVDSESINFVFPKIFKHDNLGGTIHFYRPSNLGQDFIVKVEPDTSNAQIIPTAKMEKGLWKLKVDWIAKDISYYNEKIIMVN